jgi:O-antigen/teichoic acid export membrane protein
MTQEGRLSRLRRRIGERLPRDRFIRRVAYLSGGIMVGQLILVAASPLLTRIYTPAEFGILALFTSFTTIIGTGVCLCYEFGIPVVARRPAAVSLVGVSFVVTALVAALLVVVMALFGPALGRLLGAPGLAPFLWLVPLVMLIHGVTVPLGAWFLRHGVFKRAVNKPLQFGSQVMAQLGLGFAGAGAAGLVIGYCAGYLARLLYLLGSLPRADRRLLFHLRPRRMWAVARQHWVYPVFSTPSYLLQSSTQMLPAVMLAVLYGPVAAGWYSLAQRMLELPVRLLSQSTSSVYLHEVARGEPAAVYRLFLRTSWRFLLIGLAGMLPLLLVAPPLFAFLFGADWRAAGVMVQCLIPSQLTRFVVVPVAQTLNVYRRQHLHLIAATLNLASLALSAVLGRALGLGPATTVLVFSLGSCLAWLVYFLFAWRVAREQARRSLPARTESAAAAPLEVD